MPKRNEIYGFEILQAMRTRKRQAGAKGARQVAGWLGIIGLGFTLGYIMIVMGF
jgi:hypothetical protein